MTTKPQISAKDKGATLIDKVQHLGDSVYSVESSDGWFYLVWPKRGHVPARCQCPAYRHGKGERCKHLWAVRLMLENPRPKF